MFFFINSTPNIINEKQSHSFPQKTFGHA